MLEFVRYAGGLSRGEARAFILQYLKSPMTSYPVDKLQLKISRYRRGERGGSRLQWVGAPTLLVFSLPAS